MTFLTYLYSKSVHEGRVSVIVAYWSCLPHFSHIFFTFSEHPAILIHVPFSSNGYTCTLQTWTVIDVIKCCISWIVTLWLMFWVWCKVFNVFPLDPKPQMERGVLFQSKYLLLLSIMFRLCNLSRHVLMLNTVALLSGAIRLNVFFSDLWPRFLAWCHITSTLQYWWEKTNYFILYLALHSCNRAHWVTFYELVHMNVIFSETVCGRPHALWNLLQWCGILSKGCFHYFQATFTFTNHLKPSP